MRPDYAREDAALAAGARLVAGVDEAGRGPLAGPVVAAAVILHPSRIPPGLDDSKKLTAAARERLFGTILATALVSIGSADAAEIDRDNIRIASLAAMR
ncbi:MAG: ribonuclease HII, partial [Pseudomonadota bacterium]|nr:ribonuclease HII [Pseudomonadota bacterium]